MQYRTTGINPHQAELARLHKEGHTGADWLSVAGPAVYQCSNGGGSASGHSDGSVSAGVDPASQRLQARIAAATETFVATSRKEMRCHTRCIGAEKWLRGRKDAQVSPAEFGRYGTDNTPIESGLQWRAGFVSITDSFWKTSKWIDALGRTPEDAMIKLYQKVQQAERNSWERTPAQDPPTTEDTFLYEIRAALLEDRIGNPTEDERWFREQYRAVIRSVWMPYLPSDMHHGRYGWRAEFQKPLNERGSFSVISAEAETLSKAIHILRSKAEKAPAKSLATSGGSLADGLLTPTQFFDRHPDNYSAFLGACRDWTLANCADMATAWTNLEPAWLVWCATRRGVLDDATLRRFALWSARQTERFMRDPRSKTLLSVVEQHANGKATDEHLNIARSEAMQAEVTAYQTAAQAGGELRWLAADAAVKAAYPDACEAAWSAAYAAHKLAQEMSHQLRASQHCPAADRARVEQAKWLRENATPNFAVDPRC